MIYDTFTAANSSKGFYSFFDDLTTDESMERIYLIKGGPGCGKSTFMKKIANYSHDKGYTVERIHCSSDPESLDGVVIEEKNIVIIDATAPHAYDMRFPGAVESLIDLSRFWDEKVLTESRNDIVRLTKAISGEYKKVYEVLKSAGLLYDQACTIAESYFDKEKTLDFVKKIIKQNAYTPISKSSKIKRRFLSSINSNGITGYNETAKALCTSGLIIDDDAMISSYILSRFASYFKKSGYNIIVFYNPLCPDTRIDHLIIPQLKYGIFSSNSIFSIDLKDDEAFKHINSKKYILKDNYNIIKNKVSLRKKIVFELVDSITHELSNIKQMHDQLEKFYINAMDYKHLNDFTDQFIENIDHVI